MCSVQNEEPESPACFLVVHNVSKKHNIGTLIRTAVAFNVKELCLVGSHKFNAFGSHGTTDYLTLKHFRALKECCKYLRRQHGCEIIGIEIDESAESVESEPFSGPTAFMMGSEGTGLSREQRQECRRLVYIPQFGKGTASLNVSVACSIVLHRFCSWAGYKEQPHQQGKFQLGQRPARRNPRGVVPLNEKKERAEVNGSTDGYLTDQSNSSSGYFSSLWA